MIQESEAEPAAESAAAAMGKLTEGQVMAKAHSSDLENVKKLNCWCGELTDVSIFRQMPNIEVINVSVNSITTLEDFAHCPNLAELYIRKNCIGDLAEIWYLRNLRKLRVLWLADNPCAAGDHYRLTVLRMLPNLQKLDNVLVTNDEVNRAMEHGLDLAPPIASLRWQANGHIAKDKDMRDSSVEISLDETNKIREELGLKPLPVDKLSPAKHRTGSSKGRNANILTAVLTLIKELDQDTLEVVANACKDRLESL
ncbi:protein C21orf2-like isoform X2 [Acanthaster planci]|uniref:Protein C21orf2-like isoform X2 n=1 Tax=Acanthaster planci TaxID=133434 RepID=A0A8B7XTX3_ACAPL|nr:protein C21orf2-like isoform X2 [Acanthaster planci]